MIIVFIKQEDIINKDILNQLKILYVNCILNKINLMMHYSMLNIQYNAQTHY